MSDSINPDHYKRLPVEAIRIIESAIEGAPTPQKAYLHGQVLKYVIWCWAKNGIEDLLKAKWYLDRLIDSAKQSDLQSLKDYPFGEPDEPPEPSFSIGDRVRVCKPGSLLDGKVGRVDIIHWTNQIEVSYEHAWELFDPSELQPVEASK